MKDNHAVRGVMLAIVQMFATGDLTDVMSTVSFNYLDHQGLGAGCVRGADGFSQVVRVARSEFISLGVSVADLIAEGDTVAARLVWTGTRTTGEQVERQTIDVVRVAAGLAVEHWGARVGT